MIGVTVPLEVSSRYTKAVSEADRLTKLVTACECTLRELQQLRTEAMKELAQAKDAALSALLLPDSPKDGNDG
jgi:hypothetical protein